MQVNDKVTRGALIGISANILKLVFNYICFLMGWTPVVFWQIVATRFLQKDELFKPVAYLVGGVADFTMSAILGVAFLFLLDYTSRKYRYLKGAGFGLTVWVGLLGTVLGQSVQEKLPVAASTVIVTLFAHLVFGLALAFFDLVFDRLKIRY